MEEKVDSVAKVCRLCGQFESIYIDVFGEEGTRRLLGLKIHAKINILIDETDPLPKTICVQCLGKLEFVCDFQEECLRTQQLLRDRYDLPPLQILEDNLFNGEVDIKPEQIANSPPSTSTTNNNSTEKNLNSTAADIENVDPSPAKQSPLPPPPSPSPPPPPPPPPPPEGEPLVSAKRNLRSSPHPKSREKLFASEGEAANRRWLRSRNTTDTSKAIGKTRGKRPSVKSNNLPVSRVTRLRSQNLLKSSTSPTSLLLLQQSSSPPPPPPVPLGFRETSHSNSSILQASSEERQTIQIPTSALNKVLTAVSSSQDVEVCVKESKGRNGDIEDISFTLELRKKFEETEDVVTVHAKVFPDQGSCLVDSEIVDLLGGDENSEFNKIITPLTKSKSSKENDSKDNNNKLRELEKRLSSISDGSDINGVTSRNPEELYRMDGEEIRVDNNVISTIVDGQSGYSCKLCKKFYERRDKCTVHVKTHLGIKQFACTLCTAKFVCKSDVMKHIRCSHTNPRPMQCPKCPKRFRSKFDLTEHDNVHKGIKPYTCNDCGQSYHHKVSLQMHVKSHLPPQNLACEYCGKVFPFRTRLLSHIGSVHLKNRRNFRCRFCYNLYSSLAVLNEHIKTRHATTYTCEICGKTFKVASKYKAHVLQHSNPKPFACNICNNKYASKAFLNEHLLKHKGLRKHVCQKCGASFAQASHLAAHRHVHGEKTHACPECGKKFNRRDNMKVHRKRHFAETGRIVSGQKNKEEDDDAADKGNDSDEKIKEDDGLSKTICIRCLGYLEFVCDFHDECHETQKRFKEKKENQLSATIQQRSTETDFNKKNVTSKAQAPSLSPARKIKKFILNETKENSENIPPLKNQSSSPAGKILTEIHHNCNENTPKSPKRISNNVSTLKPPITLTNEKWTPLASTIKQKSVKIRPSLQKFIWNPCESKSPTTLPMSSKCTYKLENLDANETSKKQKNTEPMILSSCQISPVNVEKSPIKKEIIRNHCSLDKEINATVMKKEISPQSIQIMEDNVNEACKIVAENCQIFDTTSQCFIELPKDQLDKSTIVMPSKSCNDRQISCESSDTMSPPKSTESKRKKTSSFYGTISQLITPKEKEAIEKFYIVNMSAVNEPKVESNINTLDKKRIVCRICNAIYSRIDKCRVHIWAHLDMKPYKCTACDFSTVTVSNIRCHIRKSHLKIKPFECTICHKRYVTAVLLEEHLNTHSGMRPFKCKFCTFTSASRQVLSYHVTTHKSVKDISCEICDKKFYSKGRMRAHMSIHNKNRNLMCKYCSQRFRSAESLQKHMDNVHSKDYICNVCGKVAKSRKALHNHQNVHLEAKYKCTLCSNTYKSGHILKEHLLKHKGIRKYKCQVCEKNFAQQSHLAAHMAVHSDKRFNCPGCNRAFNRHDNMKIHTKKCVLFNANPNLKDMMMTMNKRQKNDNNNLKISQSDNVIGEETKDIELIESPLIACCTDQIIPLSISSREQNVDNTTKETIIITENIIGLDCF